MKFPPLEVNKLQDYKYGDILNDEYFENLINTLEVKTVKKITFRFGPGRDKTNVRIAKSYYPYKFIEYLKTKSDFEYKGTNRINHVFVYLGTVENAEFKLNSHYTVFKNMNKKLNQYFIENKNKGELTTNKILSDDNDSLRKNNRILLDERNEYMELTEKQRQMIIQLEKENKELRKKELRLEALESAGVDNWGGYDYAMDLLSELEGPEE